MIKKIIKEPNGETSMFLYIPNIFTNDKIDTISNWLKNKHYREGITHWNNSSIREQLWFQEDNKYFCEQWTKRYPRWESNRYDDELLQLQQDIQNILDKIDLDYTSIQKPKLNSVLCNKYRNKDDSIKPHRDTALTFGTTPTIVGLSIGATRRLKVKRLIYDKDNPNTFLYDNEYTEHNFDIPLENGSLFIMAGSSQKYFSHEIPKEEHDCGERFSLTFREVI
jgi:alkylated DNA repair dioxygenase AlkB